MKHCTTCHSTNVRRSGVHPAEAGQHPFHSPYRCLDCDARFWVVSRRARLGAAASGAVALAIVIAFAVPTISRMSTAHMPVSSESTGRMANDVGNDPATQQMVDLLIRKQADTLTRQAQAIPPIESTPR